MRGETMKDKSKKSTYSTTFGVDPPLVLTRLEWAQKKRGNVVLIDAVSALLFKMGWLTRLELVTRGTTIRCSTY